MQAGSNRADHKQPPWEKEGGKADSFGAWLRRQREIREIPLHEIAEVTKISVRYLEALEQDRFDVLPAPVFAKGFLRQYSRYVGLDPDEVINSYLTVQQDLDEPEEAVPAGGRSQRSSVALLAAAVLLVLLVVAALVLYGDRVRSESEAPPPIAAPPVAAPPEPRPRTTPVTSASPTVEEGDVVPAAEVPPIGITMDFTEDCWVEAVIDDEPRLSELHVQGESLRLEAERRVVLTLGNPGGVHIEVNGLPYEPTFAPGRVARDLVIDLETAGIAAGTEE